MVFSVNSNYSNIHTFNKEVSNGVDTDFSGNIFNTLNTLGNKSAVIKNAIEKLDNVIILKDKNSTISDKFEKTADKFEKYAKDSYGFVSKADKAIVFVQDNHARKEQRLEGSIADQASDTATHEIGHLIDEELSTTDEFKNAYLTDLKNIHQKLSNKDNNILGENLEETLVYLKHYMEGVNFNDGIDETDIKREGLRENFAECFSTLVDEKPTKINKIYAALFPNTMKVTKSFVI